MPRYSVLLSSLINDTLLCDVKASVRSTDFDVSLKIE